MLLIVDKTETKDHSNQLSRYYDDVVTGRTQFGKVQKQDLYPVYFKTGNQPVSDDRRIEEIQNYKVFNRQDILAVLDGYTDVNPILMDFRQYLQGLEDQTNSYLDWTLEAKRESWWAWEGFFRHLECKLDIKPRMGNGSMSQISQVRFSVSGGGSQRMTNCTFKLRPSLDIIRRPTQNFASRLKPKKSPMNGSKT